MNPSLVEYVKASYGLFLATLIIINSPNSYRRAFLQNLFSQQIKWREAHGVKNTGNCGENFASSVDFLRLLHRVEEVIVVNVPVHTKRALVHCFRKIDLDLCGN